MSAWEVICNYAKLLREESILLLSRDIEDVVMNVTFFFWQPNGLQCAVF
jgi:chemotaxis methyl-accepting protein methylase